MLETIDRTKLGGKRASVLLCLLVVAFAVASGCSFSSGGKGGVPLVTNFEEIDKHIKELAKDRIVNGCLVTYDTSNLAGKLPPAEPVDVITRGNPDLKRVAITIDDGWNADMRILDLFKRLDIKFTAFLIIGRGIGEAHPEFIRQIQESGGEVCSHTYSHYVMRDKSEEFVLNEIWRSQEIIASVTHEVYPYIRFAGGEYEESSLQWTAEQGFWVVNWTISSCDTAKEISVDVQISSILGNLQPGGIIVCHFGGKNTYEVLARVIPEMQARGYEVTSLSRVLEGTPYLLKKMESPKEDGGSKSGDKKQ